MNSLRRLEELGQSIWYDNISRSLIRGGKFRQMIEQGLLGVTSNPTIFEKAIAGSPDYDDEIRELVRRSPRPSTEEVVRGLMVHDIQAATDLFAPVYERTGGRDGFVSIEVTPSKARQTEPTIEEARFLWNSVGRPNLMIKIPATREGLPAIRQATAEGININVTLIFSVERYRQVAEAFLAGLEDRAREGKSLNGIMSVASVFVSRIDTLVDELLLKRAAAVPADGERCRVLLGKTAVANTKLVYQAFRETFAGNRFEALRSRGAAVQRPLWGSTSTKNPAYPDLLYVDTLIGPHTVNTVPPATYEAILDHGSPALTLEQDIPGARRVLADVTGVGIDIPIAMQKLEDDGVAAFEKSFDGLNANVAAKMKLFG
jgi:transaldolase